VRRPALLRLVALAAWFPHAAAAQGAPGDGQPPTVAGGRKEPQGAIPADPLAISPEVRERIGGDVVEMPAPASGALERRFRGVYEERRGDYSFRTLPPLWLEHTRGLGTPTGADRESLYGLLYYQRRSRRRDADVAFPFFWRFRDGDDATWTLFPFVHREAPGRTDNWLMPLAFAGGREDGGYFHAPLFLTTSSWSQDRAFTLSALYFRTRTRTDVDAGIVPFYFHGDNGSEDGARRTYTLIPPLLFYDRWNELERSAMTVAGPVIVKSDPKRFVLDVAPIFFHIHGKPEEEGVKETHTTLFPLFHYGRSEGESLFATPLYVRRVTEYSDTMLTPFYSRARTTAGDDLTLAGPIVPLYVGVEDKALDAKAFAIAPFYLQSSSRRGFDFVTPIFANFRTYGASSTTWIAPTLVVSTDQAGWETDFHPIAYFGRSGSSQHSVVAPLYWDFWGAKSRGTVAFPFVWRFANHVEGQVTQVVVNTLYTERRVKGGADWKFHFIPLFSFGSKPAGHSWDFLYGLVGYERDDAIARLKLLWLPIQVAGGSSAPKQSARAE
jgi:hypothetical protein